jgi:hypothetical protein
MKQFGQKRAEALGDSLGAIKQARYKLRLLTASQASPGLLASQIVLYDVLLREISVIRNTLAWDRGRTHQASSSIFLEEGPRDAR